MRPSRLTERHATLVLDASVALNLLATGRPADVLRPLGRRVVMAEAAAEEVVRDPSDGGSGRAAIEKLIAAGVLEIVRLTDAAQTTFVGLVGVPVPDGLDDGEAATLAHALDVDVTPLLDERKAVRIAGERGLPSLCTLDLLSAEGLADAVGPAEVAAMVHAALRLARMRVAPSFLPWVVDTVGLERLRDCSSIPRRVFAAKP